MRWLSLKPFGAYWEGVALEIEGPTRRGGASVFVSTGRLNRNHTLQIRSCTTGPGPGPDVRQWAVSGSSWRRLKTSDGGIVNRSSMRLLSFAQVSTQLQLLHTNTRRSKARFKPVHEDRPGGGCGGVQGILGWRGIMRWVGGEGMDGMGWDEEVVHERRLRCWSYKPLAFVWSQCPGGCRNGLVAGCPGLMHAELAVGPQPACQCRRQSQREPGLCPGANLLRSVPLSPWTCAVPVPC